MPISNEFDDTIRSIFPTYLRQLFASVNQMKIAANCYRLQHARLSPQLISVPRVGEIDDTEYNLPSMNN